MLADEFPEIGLRAPVGRGGASQSLRLETADPDGVVAAAVAAGAVLERPVTDAPYGRGGVVVDPDGHRWMVSREAPTAQAGDVVYASLWAPDAGRTRRFFDGVLGGLGALGTADGATPTLMCCYEVTDVDAAVGPCRAAAAPPTTRGTSRTGAPPTASTTRASRSRCTPATTRRCPRARWPTSSCAFPTPRGPGRSTAPCWAGGSIPGGERGYWHPRRSDGEFPAPMFGLVGGAAEARVVPTFAGGRRRGRGRRRPGRGRGGGRRRPRAAARRAWTTRARPSTSAPDGESPIP